MSKTINVGYINDTINGIKINSNIKCNVNNYTNSSSRTGSYVVMHFTANVKDKAKSNALYFANENSYHTSAHFFVDDLEIYQSVELRDIAHHCGTKGTYYHNACRNSNSVGIEMCCTLGNYKISELTKRNAAFLCAYMCNILGISASDVDTFVLRHYDVTHKECPAQMVNNVKEWKEFKDLVKSILKNYDIKTGKKIEKTDSNSSTDKALPKSNKTSSITSVTKTNKKIDDAKSYSKNFKGSYKTTSNLNLRIGAGTKKNIITTIPKGATVNCYGYYTSMDNDKWYLIEYKSYKGYAISKYLKKV